MVAKRRVVRRWLLSCVGKAGVTVCVSEAYNRVQLLRGNGGSGVGHDRGS